MNELGGRLLSVGLRVFCQFRSLNKRDKKKRPGCHNLLHSSFFSFLLMDSFDLIFQLMARWQPTLDFVKNQDNATFRAIARRFGFAPNYDDCSVYDLLSQMVARQDIKTIGNTPNPVGVYDKARLPNADAFVIYKALADSGRTLYYIAPTVGPPAPASLFEAPPPKVVVVPQPAPRRDRAYTPVPAVPQPSPAPPAPAPAAPLPLYLQPNF
jgi:hypothetical protein